VPPTALVPQAPQVPQVSQVLPVPQAGQPFQGQLPQVQLPQPVAGPVSTAPAAASASAPALPLSAYTLGLPYSPYAYGLTPYYGMPGGQSYATPMTQEQAAEQAARNASEYFTNGAEATGVPSTGPGAAFFQNG